MKHSFILCEVNYYVCSVIILMLEILIKAFLNNIISQGAVEVIDVVGIILFSIAFVFDIEKSKRLHIFKIPLIIGYFERIAIMFLDIYGRSLIILPNSGSDTEVYYYNSIHYADGVYVQNSFSRLMGTIMKLIGTSRLYNQFIILLFSVLTLLVFSRITYELNCIEYNKMLVFTIVCILPNYAILSSTFLRESLITLFITLSVYMIHLWITRNIWRYYGFALIFTLAASWLHGGSAAIIIGYIAVLMLYDRKNDRFRFTLKNVLPTVLIILVFSFLFINYSSTLFTKLSGVNSVSDIADNKVRGGSSYAAYVGDSSKPINLLIYTVPRILYFLFSPFPWQWRGISDIIAALFSSMFYLITIIYSIKYILSRNNKNRSIVISYTIVAVCNAFVYAWGVTNVGTAVRHRDKVVILWALLLMLTYSYRKVIIKGKSNRRIL